MAVIEVLQGDITKLEVDAIVNEANRSLLGVAELMVQFIVQQDEIY